MSLKIERVNKMKVTGKYTNMKENEYTINGDLNTSYKNVYVNDYKTLTIYLKLLKERKKSFNKENEGILPSFFVIPFGFLFL